MGHSDIDKGLLSWDRWSLALRAPILGLDTTELAGLRHAGEAPLTQRQRVDAVHGDTPLFHCLAIGNKPDGSPICGGPPGPNKGPNPLILLAALAILVVVVLR